MAWALHLKASGPFTNCRPHDTTPPTVSGPNWGVWGRGDVVNKDNSLQVMLHEVGGHTFDRSIPKNWGRTICVPMLIRPACGCLVSEVREFQIPSDAQPDEDNVWHAIEVAWWRNPAPSACDDSFHPKPDFKLAWVDYQERPSSWEGLGAV